MTRIQIDNLIRYYFILIAEDEKYIDYVLAGDPINKFKDINKKVFRDQYLVERIENHFTGVAELYSKYCGHIHFGMEHIEKIKTPSANPNAKYTVTIGGFENYTQKEREESIIDMAAISTTIFTIINDWLKTKQKFHYVPPSSQ